MKTLIFIYLSLIVLTACTSKNNSKEEIISAIAAEQETPEELAKRLKQIKAEEEAFIASELAKLTTLKFDKLTHDFGKVKSNSDNSYKFKVTNTGEKPLIIEKVSASCGCTTPHKPEDPILPGKFDFIEVVFHPKPGQRNAIEKTVTVEANIKEKITELKIRAFIETY